MTSSILNGPAFTHAALQATDEQAFHLLLSTMVMPGVTLDGFIYENVAQDPDDPTKANLTTRILPARAPIDQWGYQDSIDLQYRRIGLAAIFDRYGQSVRTDLPTTVREVMQAYFSAAGLQDRSAQFEDGVIDELGVKALRIQSEQFLLYGEAALEIKARQRLLTEVLIQPQVTGFQGVEDFDEAPLRTLILQLTALNTDTLPYPLQPEWMELGTPQVLGGYAQDNTHIVLTAFGDGFYIGARELVYTRLDFGWYTMGNQIFLEGPPVPTLTDILDQVSSQTGFPLSLDDVEPQVFDRVNDGDVQTLTIFFKPQNLRYVGELTVDYKAV